MQIYPVIPQPLGTGDSPTFAGLTITGNSVFGLNSSVFQPATDSTTFFQVLDADGGTPILNIDSTNERVGIGQATPTASLHLSSGGMIIDSTIATGLDMSGGTFATAVQNWPATPTINIAGEKTIKFDAANFNTFLGYQAAEGRPGGITQAQNEGSYNLLGGYQTGYRIDSSLGGLTGKNNVLLGHRAGYGAASGNKGFSNVALGTNALWGITTGAYNFALGDTSLQSLTTGTNNVALGRAALFSNLSGGGNIGIGAYAGFLTTGQTNVGIGNTCLRFNTSGSNNVAIGNTALFYSNTGSSNVVIGDAAGFGVTGQPYSFNTLIGKSSGYRLSTGSSNVFLGSLSGSWQVANSNLLIIDNQARGSAAAELTDTLIYGVFNAAPASQSLRFNVGTTTWHNATHEDTDGGRESIFNFKGQQSGGEETTLARIEISHDGAADDEKGKIVISTNDGSDTDTPTDHVKIDAAGITYIGDGGTTNYTKIEADGTIEFNGAATVWNDANLGVAQLALPVAGQPDEDEFVDEAGDDTGISTWAFAVGEKVSGSIEIPHDYKEGSDITFHVHWQGIAAPIGTDNVKWQCTYTIAQAEATLDAPATTVVETAYDTQYEFKISSCTAITGTNFNMGDQFLFTLERVAAAGDAYAGDALVATVGIHYECDTVGSRAILTK